MSVLVVGLHGPEQQAKLRTAAGGLEVTFAPRADATLAPDPGVVRAVLSVGQPSGLSDFPGLTWVHGAAAGMDALLTEEILNRSR